MNIQSALDEKIRKLQQLRDLLSDPEIAKIARNLLSQRNGAEPPAPTPVSSSANVTRRIRRSGRKRGALLKAALDIVKSAAKPLTAKDVTGFMELNGFNFEAKDKQIAVSKALRVLAGQRRIGSERTGRGKAPLVYSPLTKNPLQQELMQ